MKRKIVCSDCEGTGVVTVHATASNQTWTHPCFTCNGSGTEVLEFYKRGREEE